MDTAFDQPVTTSRLALRIAVGAMFFMAGLCFASWASRIPSIQQTLHLSDAGLGGVLLAIPTRLMCSLPFTGLIISKYGSRGGRGGAGGGGGGGRGGGGAARAAGE